jgi:hypothetical protein
MLDRTSLLAVAGQLMNGPEVVIEGRSSRVTRTGGGRFRTVQFLAAGREYQAIEQNPDKPSRWAQLARQGCRVVQFRDLQTHKYVAVSVDEEIHEYGRDE